jgi:SAM-dependent methyltransferase
MSIPHDGSAGDVNYAVIGPGYARYRQPELLIAARIVEALGEARTVLNVGAGAGSYEPRDREVTAVEPSATMRAQRPADLPVAIEAVAEDLPFADGTFDAALASVTVHQWRDLAAGIGELRRVTNGPIVVLTADPDRLFDYWVADYFPDPLAVERRRFPAIGRLQELLGPTTRVEAVGIPLACTDGFAEAYYGRPEMFLDAGARRAMSSYSLVDPASIDAGVERLAADLAAGAWDARYGHLRSQPFFDGSLRLVVRP